MVYSSDSDLIKIRPKILELGVSSWVDKHSEAYSIINRDLKAWYNINAYDYGIDPAYTPFDPLKLLNSESQLKRLSCFKTLELAYNTLTKDIPDDPFALQRDYFSKEYKEELKIIMDTGLDYDWNVSGDIDDLERENIKPKLRLLERV